MDNNRAYLYHKLRSPLAVIKSALSLIGEGRTGQISEQTKKFIDQAYQKTEELILFIDQMEQEESLQKGGHSS
ncbi:hypothetical protein HYZ70_02130 [Candidatus Curtissbacteria bacterium]|nr:hypothetical protein [Candidatus Curtissbacteria bacterium]